MTASSWCRSASSLKAWALTFFGFRTVTSSSCATYRPTPPPTEVAASCAAADDGAGAAVEDQGSVDARRIFPFVLLHSPERVEQSGNPVQFFSGSEVQLERASIRRVGTARSPYTAIGTSPVVDGTSAARIFMRIPLDGPCVGRDQSCEERAVSSPNCVQQVPPNTNPDDTLPGFALSTGYEAYLAYKDHGFNGAMGNILITTPWANPADTRLKPQAFEGAIPRLHGTVRLDASAAPTRSRLKGEPARRLAERRC